MKNGRIVSVAPVKAVTKDEMLAIVFLRGNARRRATGPGAVAN